MKAAIFYFSGTGNTWWVTNQLQEKLTEKGITVNCCSAESNDAKEPKKVEKLMAQADIVGFGYPIYGSDIPKLFMDFIKQLPKVEKKAAFVYTTMMLFSGDGAIVAKRQLRKKGFRVKQAINIRMPNNVKLPYPIFKHFPIRNGEENDEVKKKAQRKIVKLVDRIIKSKRWIQGNDPFNIIGGLMQRIEMRLIDLSIYARNFFVDEATCIQCMDCVNNCPTNNIVFEEGEFSWEDRCILCLRCYHFCPVDAIQYKKPTLDRKRYPRYKGPGNGFSVDKLK
ncbi:MAG: hypothetical protein GF308_14765 [Candidatus Heimdallarchaeota archaeon]|nr:hypothetical protein [Candidatus Heimdallarchaeota archaeon]